MTKGERIAAYTSLLRDRLSKGDQNNARYYTRLIYCATVGCTKVEGRRTCTNCGCYIPNKELQYV